MAKSSLGTLTVNILAKTAGIEKGTRKGRAAFRNLEKEVKQVEKAIGTSMKVAGAAVAGFAAATAYAVKQELSLIATQKDLAKSMNATVTGIRAVNMAAADNSIDGLDGSLARFTRRLGAVENGGGPAAAAVKALRLDVEQLGKVDADEKLALVADAIKSAGISSQQATRYLQDMGFEQRGIYNIFAEGGDSIRQYREQVEAYGLAVSEIDAEKIGLVDDSFNVVSRTLQGVNTQLSIELSGILAASAQAFEEWALESADSVSRVSSAVETLIEGLAFTVDVLDSLGRIGELTWNVMRTGVATLSAGLAKLNDMMFGPVLQGLISIVKVTREWKLPSQVLTAAFNQITGAMEFTLDVFESLYRIGDITFKTLRAGAATITASIFELADSAVGTLLSGLEKVVQVGAKLKVPGAKEAAELFAGFQDGLSGMAESSARIAAEAAQDVRDAVENGLNTPFKASKAFRQVANDAADATKDAFSNLPTADQLIDGLESAKGVLTGIADATATVAFDAANRTREAWEKTLNEPLSGEAFKTWIEEARIAGEEAAAALAGGGQSNAGDDPVEETRARLSGELQALVDYQKEKEELLLEQYQREEELLNESLEANKISYEDYTQAMLNIDKKLKDSQKKLDQQTTKERFKGAASFFGNMSTLMNTESRKLFEIGKIASYAGAVVSGIEAAVSSFAFGAKLGGPALGASFAAASVAATGVQIAAIANTQFGGGTAAVSNTQAVNAVTEPVQQQAPVATQEIYLRGIDPEKQYDGAQILEALNRQIEDGGRIVGVI